MDSIQSLIIERDELKLVIESQDLRLKEFNNCIEALDGCMDAEIKVRIMMTEAADKEAIRAEVAEAWVRELEEGLRPFAAIGADVSPVLADRAPYSTGRASVGDFRRVHALLDKLSKATHSESEHV